MNNDRVIAERQRERKRKRDDVQRPLRLIALCYCLTWIIYLVLTFSMFRRVLITIDESDLRFIYLNNVYDKLRKDQRRSNKKTDTVSMISAIAIKAAIAAKLSFLIQIMQPLVFDGSYLPSAHVPRSFLRLEIYDHPAGRQTLMAACQKTLENWCRKYELVSWALVSEDENLEVIHLNSLFSSRATSGIREKAFCGRIFHGVLLVGLGVYRFRTRRGIYSRGKN